MEYKYLLLISLFFISSINSIDISILKGDINSQNKNTPIVINIVSEEIKEKSSNVVVLLMFLVQWREKK